MPYDELIKRLKEIHPKEFGDAWDFAFACQQTMREAADAIEELSILANNGEATYEIMVRQTSYIKELKQKIPNWIPVTERLPERGDCVLAYEDGDIMMASYYSDYSDGKWYLRDMYEIIELKPTHWMPLPQPPEEGE